MRGDVFLCSNLGRQLQRAGVSTPIKTQKDKIKKAND